MRRLRKLAAERAAYWRGRRRYWEIELVVWPKDSSPWARYRCSAAVCNLFATLWETLA